MSLEKQLRRVYRRLSARYGAQNWWPADEPFEVIVGAILTQSTAWSNVEKTIRNLNEAGVLTPSALRAIPIDELAGLVRPAGYYNVKARKLKAFAEHLGTALDDSLERMFYRDTNGLRAELLSIYGVGEETADSILLYAARKPVFVIDAYTHRIMDRLGLNPDTGSYGGLQAVFMKNLPHDEGMFNEYHALLVRHGKDCCRKRPACSECCLADMCSFVT